jgi:cell division septation protein DedD
MILGLAASLYAMPAMADVKAGVDAWSRGDYPAAVKEWRQPAMDGDADAQFNLGQAYKLGRGVPADPKLAEDWFRKAALQGHVQAEDNYGLILFQNGDRQKALPYIQKSAGRGEPRAQYIIATALFNGDLIEKDWPRAYALMTRASASGLGAASASLAQMDKYIPLEQRQKGLAIARDLEQIASRPLTGQEPVTNASARPAAAARNEGLSASKPVAAAPKPKPEKAVPAPATGGRWRVQLGALDNEARARAQWTTLKGRIGALAGLEPSYEKAGPFTRLRAGPIASKAAAEQVCASAKAAGQACFPVAP